MAIIDAWKLENGFELTTDICIVGAGAAGISIAREFKNCSQRICLVESGKFSFDKETQSLYEIENVGHPWVREEEPRNRYFGGTTNTWTGRCLKLDRIDFEEREWVSDSGWPISYSELDPYYDRAALLFKIPDFKKINAAFWQGKPTLQDEKLLFSDKTFEPVVSLRGKSSIRFGSAYLNELNRSKNIDICINANITEIELSENLSTVTRLHLTCLNQVKLSIKANIFILACGGLENARILLLSRNQNYAGLGNNFDNVGRYYMEHPMIDHGMIFTDDENFNAPLFFGHRTFDGTVQFGVRLSEEVQRREKLLNHYILLQPRFSKNERNYPTPQSLANKLLYFSRKLSKQPLKFDFLLVKNYLEQRPNRESRVTLSSKRDKLGLNLLKLDWKISSQEKQDMHRFHLILSKYLETHHIGRLENIFPENEASQPSLMESFHHMGTTRMSDNPRRGVVDKNCKVHSINNLFIAGSSVFPTGGYANPTLAIVALAIRLADHIKQLPFTVTLMPSTYDSNQCRKNR